MERASENKRHQLVIKSYESENANLVNLTHLKSITLHFSDS